MLRPYRIQTVYLDDFGPIGQSAKYVHFHTRTHFLAACSVENASPSSQLKLYHCLSDLTEPLAAKLPCLGTFGAGGFELNLSCHPFKPLFKTGWFGKLWGTQTLQSFQITRSKMPSFVHSGSSKKSICKIYVDDRGYSRAFKRTHFTWGSVDTFIKLVDGC